MDEESVLGFSKSINSKADRALNTEATEKKRVGRPPGKSTKAGSREHTPEGSSAPPPQPAPPPPPRPTRPADPKVKTDPKKTAREEKDEERRVLERKVRMYAENPRLAKILGKDFVIPENLDRLTDDALKSLYQRIQDRLNFGFREQYVARLLGFAFMGIEKTFDMVVKDSEMEGLAEAAQDPVNMLEFEPELSQLAIEISDDMIPSPKWRLALKIAQFVMAFHEAKKQGKMYEEKKQQQQQQRRGPVPKETESSKEDEGEAAGDNAQ